MKKIMFLTAVLGLLGLGAAEVANTPVIKLNACAGCHGANFEKPAMGYAPIVANEDADTIYAKLKGYQEGKGGKMKNIMKGQVARYSDAELRFIADKISSEYNPVNSVKLTK